jgi:hypothetical protein
VRRRLSQQRRGLQSDHQAKRQQIASVAEKIPPSEDIIPSVPLATHKEWRGRRHVDRFCSLMAGDAYIVPRCGPAGEVFWR